ncbi:MAG: hypothetical protein LC107_08905, partial [Chitinophagales bacterium]|nr:hypothetical protein [Chitinophagales bacterium]
ELRGNSSACSPQTLYTEYDGCIVESRDTIISFALGYGLYSTESILFTLCGGISVPVTYTFTTCVINYNNTVVHFVHNLHYDLNALIAACPALKAQISYHNLNGTIESFLDALDHDISSQVEFTEAYNETKLYYNQPEIYSCSEPGHIFYSIKYIKNTCYKWVLKGVTDTGVGTTPGTGSGDGSFVISQEDCGSTVCCARSAKYCVQNYENGEPNLIISTPRNYQKFEGSCPEECTHDCGGPIIGPMTPTTETPTEGDI